jgi:dipeptidyl aminopeptidase/acylaminoacyl peptidase
VRTASLFTVTFSFVALLPVQGLQAQGTMADYERFLKYRERMQPLATGIVNEANWIGKTNRFWYSRTTAKGVEYLIADTAGAKTAAFDQDRLAKALADATGETVDGNKLRLGGILFKPDDGSVQFFAMNARWSLDLNSYKLTKLSSQPVFGSITGPGVAEVHTPVASPDGKQELVIQNYNVWVRAKGSKQAVALSTDGSEFNYYALSNEAWSPNGKFAAAYRIRPGQRRKITYVESSPADQVQPKTRVTTYVKPGDALDVPMPVLFDVEKRKQFEIESSLFANPYWVSPFEWRKDSRAFTFEYNQRGHQVYRVIEVDAATGKPRAVVDEKVATFFCYYSKHFRKDVGDGKEVIWMSERDGWNHLYLIDGATGAVKTQITKGEWVVRSVAAVDEEKHQIYFVASGMDRGKDPYFRQLFRVNFDGTGLTRLTTADADHDVRVSPDYQTFVSTASRVDLPAVTELRRTSDGSVVASLEKADDTALRAAGWKPPEVITSKGRDGKTDIWGVLYRPSNFDASRKYPVLEYIYAGPHDSFVPKTFSPLNDMQAVAELGFIVVQMDGMGTSNRSKAFHDVCWKNIGDAGFPDRIAWHKTVAAKYAWYDVERLGIYGHSAGGQNSLGALLFHGDFYKAAASSAGCHDNRMDKISWNEQWMGWPVGPEYAASSNVDHAANLKGKLLLAVGELDTNVDPSSTMQVVNALIKAKKTFDLLFLPGANHGGWGEYWDRKRADFFVRTLLGVEPPNWNSVGTEVRSTAP